MMKEVFRKNKIYKLIELFNEIYYSEGIGGGMSRKLNRYSRYVDELVYNGEIYRIKELLGKAVWQESEGHGLKLWDSSFKVVAEFGKTIYFNSLQKVFVNRLIASIEEDGVLKPVLVDERLGITPFTSRYVEAETGTGYICPDKEANTVTSIDKDNFDIQWEINCSDFGTYIDMDIDGNPISLPSKLHRNVFANEKTVFIPMKSGQLIALDAVDSSHKWFLKTNKSYNDYAFRNPIIYLNTGRELVEIDADSGLFLRDVDYKKGNNLQNEPAGAKGPFKVYDDYILLNIQIRGIVLMINRATFKLEEIVEVGQRLGAGDIIHWNKGRLYVLDMTETLHIFEKAAQHKDDSAAG